MISESLYFILLAAKAQVIFAASCCNNWLFQANCIAFSNDCLQLQKTKLSASPSHSHHHIFSDVLVIPLFHWFIFVHHIELFILLFCICALSVKLFSELEKLSSELSDILFSFSEDLLSSSEKKSSIHKSSSDDVSH